MTKKLIFATTNQGKLKEVRQALPSYEILSLLDFPEINDVDEPFTTFVENAEHKARLFFDQTGIPVLAEDSGIEVDFLTKNRPQAWEGNMTVPGVYSARYASLVTGLDYLDHNENANNQMTLLCLDNTTERQARYLSTFVYFDGTDTLITTGSMEGRITKYEPRGDNGFAYDTIFEPKIGTDSYSTLTYAQMDNKTKNRLSHRVEALKKMVAKLN